MRRACIGLMLLLALAASAAPPRQIVNEKDGSVLLLVPAGPFTMGSDSPDAENDDKPAHKVTLPDYYIGKFDITNAQYRKFVESSHYKSDGDWDVPAKENGDDAPVIHVSWIDANHYCHWAGVRLPSEAEWEKAARGTDGRIYPWGNDMQWDQQKGIYDDRLVWGEKRYYKPQPVGTRPAGASPYGCLDMAGNVCQWTGSQRNPYDRPPESLPGNVTRVIRGSNYNDDRPEYVWLFNRWTFIVPEEWSEVVGFRVAR